MKRVLVIVYYFPPMGGSGVQRPLKFIKYLKDFGWEPVVLCPEPGAYHTFDEALHEELIQTGVEVVRVDAKTPFHAFGDKKRIKIGGLAERILRKISTFFWIPDNKKGWITPALNKAYQMLNSGNFDLLFASAPPYSNLIIASELSQLSGLPFVADLRDDWVGSHLISYPTPWHRHKMTKMEAKVLGSADRIITTNSFIADSVRRRLPMATPMVIQHGFDESDFSTNPTRSFNDSQIHFLYSGMLYPQSNADTFFEAVRLVIHTHPEFRELIKIHFQGNTEERYLLKAREAGLMDMVVIHGYLDHKKAVNNLMMADVLWLNNEHPKNPHLISLGKTFEYMGARKPILAMIPDGAVKEELKQYGAAFIHPPGEPLAVAENLAEIISLWKSGRLPVPDETYVSGLTRKEQCRKLAGLFDELV